MKFITFGSDKNEPRPRPTTPVAGDTSVEGDLTRGLGQGVGIAIGLVAAGFVASKLKGG
jgi:hypothetical protein